MGEFEKSLPLGILGCFGGMFIHLIVGAYFQWGFINVYITSYYKITEPELTLESNGIVFPLMQLCIAPTMKFGTMLANYFGSFPVLITVEILVAGVVFASSFLSNFTCISLLTLSFCVCIWNWYWWFGRSHFPDTPNRVQQLY